jgi:death-on-curing protein
VTGGTISRPSVETVIAIHDRLIAQIGGLDGLRDANLLDMSVNAPFQTFDGIDLYPNLIDKASHLAYSLIKNHAFLDGNKRVGVTVLLVFLKANGIQVECTNAELTALGLGIADGTVDEAGIKKWLACHIQVLGYRL